MDTIVSIIAGASGASVRGASHAARGKPNQDAVAWDQSRLWTYIAVADGHGGAPHYRSDRGSLFAVTTLVALLRAVTLDGALRAPEALAATIPGVADDLVARWRKMVEADIARDPVPEPPGVRSLSVYGSTCLGAAIGPGLSLMLQIGDGDLFAATPSGDVERLFQVDELPGEQTYSLCLPDAAEHVNVAFYSAPNRLCAPDFIFASTDGLVKSFDGDETILSVMRGYRQAIRDSGLREVSAGLGPWLSECSERGSGDDISVAIFTTDVEDAKVPANSRSEKTPAPMAERQSPTPRRFGREAMLAMAALGGFCGLLVGFGSAKYIGMDPSKTVPVTSRVRPATPLSPPRLPVGAAPNDGGIETRTDQGPPPATEDAPPADLPSK